MELHQLEYFVAVAEEGGFTAGARRAGVVQSAASTAVRRLEAEFGLDLFTRAGRRVELTEPGRTLLADAREIIAATRFAREHLQQRGEGLTGTVTIGTLLATGSLDLAAALRTFHAQHPAVYVRLRHRPGHSETHLAAVAEGAVDLAVVLVPGRVPDGVRIDPVAAITPALVASPHHDLAGRAEVRLADLAGKTFIDFPAGWGNRDATDALFRTAGVHRTVSIEATDIASTLELVAGGLGLAFVPESAAGHHGGVVRIRLAAAPPTVPLGIASTSRRRLSPATDALRRALLVTA
ncbi:LysR family transcriptional regulator [Amycolatopsis sp. WQ 127309]|uniref:LysR family transcriptional regulator n=1 Tax=Amycolatopsis sp. WQ 127309 TaxID=2932773 RepID=UPI001FF23B1E|nr:LysR family transcriptional regulator [Amycolatopsis sp. WQ 127309]UOZ06031.1 LysR family transcriptional regulator [Amycolatopsis sp. WQ 127309]